MAMASDSVNGNFQGETLAVYYQNVGSSYFHIILFNYIVLWIISEIL